MKAIQVHPETKKLYIGESDEPKHTDCELLVSVKATALNRADLLQKRGLYPPPPGATDILGLEMAGVVVEGTGTWKKGDRVMGLLPGGGYAERVRIPSYMAVIDPEWEWSRVQQAHEHMENNRNVGKIILNIL